MPKMSCLDIPAEEPAQMLTALWRAVRLQAGPPHSVGMCPRTHPDGPRGRRVLLPILRRSLLALLRAPPRAHRRYRTRWSCVPLALTWHRPRGIAVSAETRRRWRHEIGWVWKRSW
jgi:hypothetical protein